jgi:hypothetical protein
MAASLRQSSRCTLLPALIAALLVTAPRACAQAAQAAPKPSTADKRKNEMASIKALPECSLAKTNKTCRLTVDRSKPVAPPTIQMYSGQGVTVVVENPKPFERYFLDYSSGQANLKPDVASSIVQGLLPSVQKLGEFKVQGFDPGDKKTDMCANMKNIPKLNPGEVDDVRQIAQACVEQLAERDIDIYRKLEPFIAPDSITPVGTAMPALPCPLQQCIEGFLDSENIFSTKISSILSDTTLKANTNPATKEPDDIAMGKLAALQKLADAVATDLQGYKQRLSDIPVKKADLQNWGFEDCVNLIDPPKASEDDKNPIQCIAIQSNGDAPGIYDNMVTRTIIYSLNILNLVSNSQEAAPDPSKKKLLATLSLNFAEGPKSGSSSLRWEASAGALFSSLPIRSFSPAPVFTNGTITDKKVSQNLLYPTVVPFAAANYRLTNDLGWTRWKSNIYWTGAVGINPNTVSADFATGLSLSWRALMVSGLCHFGHDVRLTQGLSVGESLGPGFNGTLSTQTYWTASFALGLSVRVPSLTGR